MDHGRTGFGRQAFPLKQTWLRQGRKVALAAVVVVVALVATGCGASVAVRVDVNRTGGGSVAVTVTVPEATAADLEDLRAGVPVADLRQAGWVVQGPHPGPAGSIWVSARHPFSQLSQVPALVADIAGSGPIGSRPFQLAVVEAKGTLEDRFTVSGKAQLDCGMACFDDPRLAGTIGYPLGIPPAQLAQILGPHPDRDLTFQLEVSLPGRVSSSDAPVRTKQALVWSPALGHSTLVAATTESVNVVLVRRLLIAIGAGALVVFGSAVALIVRRRRRHLGVTVTGSG